MTEYDVSRDKIVTLGSQLISVERAERLIGELESAVETAHEYRNNEELQDTVLNERALNHLLDPTENDYTLVVDVGYSEDAELADGYLGEIIYDPSEIDTMKAQIDACDIHLFYDDSDGIERFYIKIPKHE